MDQFKRPAYLVLSPQKEICNLLSEDDLGILKAIVRPDDITLFYFRGEQEKEWHRLAKHDFKCSVLEVERSPRD